MDRRDSGRHGRRRRRLQRLPVAGADAEAHLRAPRRRDQHAAQQVTDQRLQGHPQVLHPYCVDDAEAVLQQINYKSDPHYSIYQKWPTVTWWYVFNLRIQKSLWCVVCLVCSDLLTKIQLQAAVKPSSCVLALVNRCTHAVWSRNQNLLLYNTLNKSIPMSECKLLIRCYKKPEKSTSSAILFTLSYLLKLRR